MGKAGENSGASLSATGEAGPRTMRARQPLRAARSGTDGLFACPSLRQLGDLRRAAGLTPADHELEAHRFASPPRDGFALSRMKGVMTQAWAPRLAPGNRRQ